MTLRKIPDDLPNIEQLQQELDEKIDQADTQWHTLHCTLVTPMYGGGVQSTVVDKAMPIRASGIRGQLRFWWRLLAKEKWHLGDIPTAETDLWGGMNQGEEDGKSSKVLIRIKQNPITAKIEPWATYKPNRKDKLALKEVDWAEVPYALFPAQGKLNNDRTKVEEEPHELLKEGYKWKLEISFLPNTDVDQKEQVWETLRWWSNFGGVGSRTSRGLGAVDVQENSHFTKVVSVQEIEALGFDARIKTANSAYSAWQMAVNKLQTFRQVGEGRNDYSSRSRWSEPDAIREITRQALPKHSQRQTKGNIFPRAAFGLPIIFKFKDNNPKGDNASASVDPRTTTLYPRYRVNENAEWQKCERLPSPLILRPYKDERGRWHALALVLPQVLHDSVHCGLALEVGSNRHGVTFWDSRQAQDIKPITNHGNTDPMQAFLNYFAK